MTEPTPEAYEVAANPIAQRVRPSQHSQLCPVWAKKRPIGECDCWILRDARKDAVVAIDAVWPLARRAVAAEIRAEGRRRRGEVNDPGGYGGHYRSIQADECERLARKIEGSTDG